MSASDLEAGRAFVRLYLQDQQYVDGLKSMGDKLKVFSETTKTTLATAAANVQKYMAASVAAGAISAANATRVISSSFTEATLAGTKFASSLMRYSFVRMIGARAFQGAMLTIAGSLSLPLKGIGLLTSSVGKMFSWIGARSAGQGWQKLIGYPLKGLFGGAGSFLKNMGLNASDLGGAANAIFGKGLGGLGGLVGRKFGGLFAEGWKTSIMAKLGAPWLMGHRGAAGMGAGLMPGGAVGGAAAGPAAAMGPMAAGPMAVGAAAVRPTGVVASVTGGFSRITTTAAAAGKAVKDMGMHLIKTGGILAAMAGPLLWLTTTTEDMKDVWEFATTTFKDFRDALQTALGTNTKESSTLKSVVIGLIRAFKDIGSGIVNWVKNNKELAGTILKVIVGVGMLGTALIVMGTALTVAGSMFATMGSALAFLLSPMTLLTAAVAAGIFYWVRYTESGKSAVSTILNAFSPMIATVKKMVGGIVDALISGDIALAAKIAGVGLQLAFLDAVAGLVAMLPKSWGKIGEQIKSVAVDIVRGDWTKLTGDLGSLWDSLCDGIVAAMGKAAKTIARIWNAMATAIGEQLAKQAKEGTLLGGLLSIAMTGTGSKSPGANAMDSWKKMNAAQDLKNKAAIANYELAERLLNDPTRATADELKMLGYQEGDVPANPQEILERAQKLKDQSFREATSFTGDNRFGDPANAAIDEAMKGKPEKPKKKTWKEQKDSEAAEAQRKLDEMLEGAGPAPETPFDKERERLRKQLDELAKQAAKQRGETPGIDDLKKLTPGGSAGTFSARVAGQMGGGPQEKIAKHTERTVKELADLRTEAKEHGARIEKIFGMMGAK